MAANSSTQSMLTRTLVAEAESPSPAWNGVYPGFSLYRVEDRFEFVFRTRTYDGIRVASKWDSKPVALDATEVEAAKAEVWERTVNTMRALMGHDPR